VLAAGLPHQDHVWITTDRLVRFHKKEFDEVPCQLDFTGIPCSFEKYQKSQFKVGFWVLLEPGRILSGIQFTKYFIEIVVVETKQFNISNLNVILMQQTCRQHSSMAAGSKRRALAFYFRMQICHMFLISKCREELDLGLCTTSVLAKRMPPRTGKVRQICGQTR